MRIEASIPLEVVVGGKAFHLEPNTPTHVLDEIGVKPLRKANGQIRELPTLEPTEHHIQGLKNMLYRVFEPFLAGSLVVYQGSDGTVCGGWDDPTNGTVEAMTFECNQWNFLLTNGLRLRSNQIRAVTLIDSVTKKPIAAWTKKECGLAGMGKHGRYVDIVVRPKDDFHAVDASYTDWCVECGEEDALVYWQKLKQWFCLSCRPINADTVTALEPGLPALGPSGEPKFHIGPLVRFDGRLGHFEEGTIRNIIPDKQATERHNQEPWPAYPNQWCYAIGNRTIPESWIQGHVEP